MEVEDDIESWWPLVRGPEPPLPEPPLSEFGDERGPSTRWAGSPRDVSRLLAALFSVGPTGVWWVSLSDGLSEATSRVGATVAVEGSTLVFTPTSFPVHRTGKFEKALIWTAQEDGDLVYESRLTVTKHVLPGDTVNLRMTVNLT